MDPEIYTQKMGVLRGKMSVRKQYPAELKAKIALEILKEEKSISQIAWG
ncbi:MAG: hypothetical protein ACPLXA_09070 [Moorellaceae bacterium]